MRTLCSYFRQSFRGFGDVVGQCLGRADADTGDDADPAADAARILRAHKAKSPGMPARSTKHLSIEKTSCRWPSAAARLMMRSLMSP